MSRATVSARAAIQQGIDDGGRKSMGASPDGDGDPGRTKPLNGLLGSSSRRAHIPWPQGCDIKIYPFL